MSDGNGAPVRSPATILVEFILKRASSEKDFSPMMRHSLRVAYGRMPTSQPIDRVLKALFQYGHEVEGVTERQFLLELMRQTGRKAPVSYPDDDKPEYMITPQGEIIWEASPPVPPPVPTPTEPEVSD